MPHIPANCLRLAWWILLHFLCIFWSVLLTRTPRDPAAAHQSRESMLQRPQCRQWCARNATVPFECMGVGIALSGIELSSLPFIVPCRLTFQSLFVWIMYLWSLTQKWTMSFPMKSCWTKITMIVEETMISNLCFRNRAGANVTPEYPSFRRGAAQQFAGSFLSSHHLWASMCYRRRDWEGGAGQPRLSSLPFWPSDAGSREGPGVEVESLKKAREQIPLPFIVNLVQSQSDRFFLNIAKLRLSFVARHSGFPYLKATVTSW